MLPVATPAEIKDTVMKLPRTPLVAAVLVAVSGAAWAIEYEHDEGTEAHVPTVAHDLVVIGPEEPVDPRTIRADLDYAAAHEAAP